jgi:hypothetical protein
MYKMRIEGKGAGLYSGMYIALLIILRVNRAHMFWRETAMTIEEVLVNQYGPLLSLTELAMILDRSPDGLRISLRSSGEWVSRINAARLRLGRRIYFRTSEIANVLDAR